MNMKETKEEGLEVLYRVSCELSLREDVIRTPGGVFIPNGMIMSCRKGKTPVNKIEFSGGKVTFVKIQNGHWIKVCPAGIYECSECHQYVLTDGIEAYSYCHHCGSKMERRTNYDNCGKAQEKIQTQP